MKRKYLEGRIPLIKVEESVTSWIAHALHADTYRLRKKLFDNTPATE